MTKARYIRVGWVPPDNAAPFLHDHVTVDMGDEYDPPTEAEMQEIAYAAKMAYAKAIRKRKKVRS